MGLKRTLEPEVMDSKEDASEYNDMDHSEVNRLFVAELLEFAEANFVAEEEDDDDDDDDEEESDSEESGDEESGDDEYEITLGDVLDIGAGTALIPIELCKQHADCRVMAIDMAVSMLDLAVYNIEVAGLGHRITLNHIDAKNMGFEDGMFHVTMSNSIIHHIPIPMDCLMEMVRVTCQGGMLFVRDLMRPNDEATVGQLVETYAGDESDYSRKLFEESLHAALSLEEIREMVESLGFDPQTATATTDRHWTWAAMKN